MLSPEWDFVPLELWNDGFICSPFWLGDFCILLCTLISMWSLESIICRIVVKTPSIMLELKVYVGSSWREGPFSPMPCMNTLNAGMCHLSFSCEKQKDLPKWVFTLRNWLIVLILGQREIPRFECGSIHVLSSVSSIG